MSSPSSASNVPATHGESARPRPRISTRPRRLDFFLRRRRRLRPGGRCRRRRPARGAFGNCHTAVALEFADGIDDRGVVDRHAGGRRLRRLGGKSLRQILGFSGRLAELAVQLRRQRALSGDVRRLSRLLARRHGAAGALANSCRAHQRHHLAQHSRHAPGRRKLRSSSPSLCLRPSP